MNIASSSSFSQSTISNVAKFWCKQISQIFQIRFFYHQFHFVDIDDTIDSINQVVSSSQFSYQHIVIMIFTYEERLITFKKWFHIISTSESLGAIEFYHDSDTEYLVICSKCDLKLNIKRDSVKTHMRQSRNCSFVQKLKINEASKATTLT